MKHPRTRPTLPSPNFHKYLKPGALARIRDSRIRSNRHDSIPHFPPPPPSSSSPAAAAADHHNPPPTPPHTFPFFVSTMCGPRFPQRKKLCAPKSVLFLPLPDSTDLIIDSFSADILAN
ncbi:uncharacterized protein LOC130743862 [Lotus japonicus]|uniref:uncharacterized protein LOC130743862 n=1 Tax=Lotus japonicus TaxID=34305 RepID=UPI00258F1FC8|nr:uncharacterized protein LOC130743862 [Lotus japonicus]